MNCFERILSILGPNTDHQGIPGMIFGVIEFASANAPEGATSYANPVTTSIAILRTSGVNEHALQLIDSYLAPLSERIAKGR